MKTSKDQQTGEALSTAIGKRIRKAGSSLNTFAIEFEEETGIIVEAGQDDDETVVFVSAADRLPEVADAVCSVDWSWISGSVIKQATILPGRLKLELDPAGPLNVSAAIWQGSPFLAFQPFRPSKV